MNKVEIDMVIGVLSSVIQLLTTLDPALGQNKIVVDIQKAISTLKSLGI